VRITILEVHNSSIGFILYANVENRHYKARYYLILVVQYTGPARGTPQFREGAVWGPLISVLETVKKSRIRKAMACSQTKEN